jgi:hypothetical protein
MLSGAPLIRTSALLRGCEVTQPTCPRGTDQWRRTTQARIEWTRYGLPHILSSCVPCLALASRERRPFQASGLLRAGASLASRSAHAFTLCIYRGRRAVACMLRAAAAAGGEKKGRLSGSLRPLSGDHAYPQRERERKILECSREKGY